MNEDYLSHLLALDRKLAFVQSDETARSAFAARDLLPAIEKLRIKALTKVCGTKAALIGPAMGRCLLPFLAFNVRGIYVDL